MSSQQQPAIDNPVSPEAAPSRLPRGLAAFQHRNYRLFFSGQLISVTGTWMQTLAQAWLVLSITDSALQFSLVNVCQFAPILLFAIPAGVVADRFQKRNILIVTQFISGVLAGTLAILVFTDRVELWHVYVLALGLGVVNSFDLPTRQAFVVEMVGRDDLMNAIALNSSLFNAARIIGPAIAGLLLAWQGPAICFGLNSISYIAVIAGLLMMRLTPMAIERGGTGIQRMREGFQYIRSMPSILMPISLVAFIAVFGLNFNIWIPLLAKKEFSTGADGFGILMSALGLGSLTGALFLAFSSRGARPRQILVTAVILGLAEVTLALFSVVPFHIIFALITLPIMGFAMSTTNAMANTIVQSASAQHMRGRVMSVYMTFFAGTAPLGAFLAGAMADRFGTPASLAFGGTVTVAAALGVAMYFHAWRPDAPAFNLNPLVQSDPMSRRLQAGSRD